MKIVEIVFCLWMLCGYGATRVWLIEFTEMELSPFLFAYLGGPISLIVWGIACRPDGNPRIVLRRKKK